MKCREFICTGAPVPQITQEEHPEFYLQVQKAILASLKQRGLLTCFQYERCMEELEKLQGKGIFPYVNP